MPSAPATPQAPWYKRLWVIISATSVIVSAILLKGPTLLQNARIMPDEVQKTFNQFMSWVKEDNAWTGHWSSFPEGIVDMEDMHLSNTDLEITIWASQGDIDGTIVTKKICKDIPILDYILLRGEVIGNHASVMAWEILQGHKVNFAELTLERDGDILIVKPVSGQTDWFPPVARIGKHPLEVGEIPESTRDFCKAEHDAFHKVINQKSGEGALVTPEGQPIRYPVEELQFAPRSDQSP